MVSEIKTCSHATLSANVSPNGEEAGFKRIDWKRRVAATTPSGRVSTDGPDHEPQSHAFTYPAPLVLPGDNLADDASYPPQSFRAWANLKERNKVTYNRRTVYVARSPSISQELSGMSDWTEPVGLDRTNGRKGAAVQPRVPPPKFEDVLAYLRAFYHGLEVKEYTPTLSFDPWMTATPQIARTPASFVALKDTPTTTATRIQTRGPSPDGRFSHQLNLSDLLDAAMSVLPRDAYALLLLVDHDLYEDDDDDFCCGRAYGGSRVAVVSSARYNPLLHGEAGGIDLAHMWPASHCASYMASQCGVPKKKKRKVASMTHQEISGVPLHKAVAAFTNTPSMTITDLDGMHGLWLFCLARTASHELGHCFGMDHCVYYACAMQGTASVAEDLRQPPYLCPVCAKKMSRAVDEGFGKGFNAEAHFRDVIEAMTSLCAKWRHAGVWAGYGAWIDGVDSC